MNFLSGFFKLVRGLNLGYIVLTQVLLQYCIIWPYLHHSKKIASNFPSLLGFDFALLVFSTVIIAASGYMINDYFDVKIDEVNKPHRVLVDRVLPKRKIMILHVLFNLIGVTIGFCLAWKVGNWKIGFVHVLAASLLWFYSIFLKRQFLIGNLVVGFLTALVVLTVLFYDRTFFSGLDQLFAGGSSVVTYFTIYALFAFLINFIRELIKDMEDIEGDRLGKCKTMPIVWGIKNTKRFTALVILLTISLLGFVQMDGLGQTYFAAVKLIYLFLLVQLPLLYVLYKLFKADKPADFRRLSNVIKLTMLTGILFLFFIKGNIIGGLAPPYFQ